MNKRTESAVNAHREAVASGRWETFGVPGSIRRMTTHTTPENLPSSWWGEGTYEEVEFISFIGRDGEVVSAVYGRGLNPWTVRHDRGVSVKRAVEILRSADAEAADHLLNPKTYAKEERCPIE